MNPLTYVIINGATLILIWTGALQVNAGSITQGEVIALVNYMSQILVELVKLANLIITMTKSLACANRVAGILEIQPGMQETEEKQVASSTSVKGEVVFEHVSLTYQNAGGASLTDIHFRAQPGQTIGIIGGTGSGKSSLISLIPRFYDATEGHVYVDGRDVRDYPKEELREKIGVVMQRAVLFAGTIRENIRWGKDDASDEEIMEALEIAQAADFVRQKEGNLSEYITQGATNLSGGQRQRLTIARALVRKPEILILDDSASALDYATDAKLRAAIRNMPSNPTVFIVSQRAASIQYADQIIVLEEGHAVDIGTHEQLLQRCGVYQEIYYSQFPREEEE